MKINVRLLLITFFIVVFVTVSSTLIYYSITISFLRSHYTNTLLKSARNFGIDIESKIHSLEGEFLEIIESKETNIDGTNLDFIFETVADSIYTISYCSNISDSTNKHYSSIVKFVSENPNVILNSLHSNENNLTYYFGKFITEDFLDQLSEKAGIQLAFIIDGLPYLRSKPFETDSYFFNIINAINELKYKNNFDFVEFGDDDRDFWAAKYSIITTQKYSSNLTFIVYLTSSERADFANSLKILLVIVLFTGIALSLILILLFTTKLRKQISYLSFAAEQTASGNFVQQIPVISNDEMGRLSIAFNNMISVLSEKEKQEKEYSEFLEIINKSPELEEISEVSLWKIINTCDLSLGSLYIIEDGKPRFIVSVGMEQKIDNSAHDINFYNDAIKNKKQSEFIFDKNHPIVRTGIAEIKISYILIVPIIYNDEVISIIELASQSIPQVDIKKYIESIHNELAIGLVNAKSLDQLENIVNELKSLNDEYKKQNDQIINQNKELLELHRTIKTKAEELEKQKEKAVKLTKVKSQFLASMSHELRTPLNSILGLTELVVNDETTSVKTSERLVVVLRNGNKLLSLINNILEFSKADSGKISLKEKEFLLSDFIEEVENFILPLNKDNDLDIIIEEPDASDYILKTDKNKLDLILTNLVGNAIKFTSEGYIKLTVNVVNDSNLIIKVEDTGIGISNDNKEKIFEEFRQIDKGTDRAYGGTGLGLAICKRYISLLDGKLEVESELNKGSIFTVSLSNVIIKKVVKLNPQLSDISKNDLGSSLPKILIANDSKNLTKFIRDYFSSNGFLVENSKTYTECVEYIKANTPKAIILSNKLDNKYGWEVLLEIIPFINIQKTKVLLTNFLQNENLGYTFLIDYFYNSDFLLKDIKINLGKNRNILFISSSQNYGSTIIQPLRELQYNIFEAKEIFSSFELLENNSISDIVVTGGNNYHEEINLISRIREKEVNKKRSIHFILPQSFNESELSTIEDATNKIIRISGFHNFDVLKAIRDSLLNPETELTPDQSSNTSKILQANLDKDMFPEDSKNIASVLIVDDDSDTLFTVGQLVEDLGYSTSFKKNGVECLISLNSHIPDLILLDIMMPQMDGFETIKRIRGNNDLKNIPVLALTAHAMIDDKGIIEKNGFNGLVTKPLNKAELAFKIQKILDNKK